MALSGIKEGQPSCRQVTRGESRMRQAGVVCRAVGKELAWEPLKGLSRRVAWSGLEALYLRWGQWIVGGQEWKQGSQVSGSCGFIGEKWWLRVGLCGCEDGGKWWTTLL